LSSRTLLFVRRFLSDRDVRVLLLANILVGVSYSFVIPFLSLFGTREVGLEPMAFSLFMVATSLGSIAFSTLLARWSDVRREDGHSGGGRRGPRVDGGDRRLRESSEGGGERERGAA